jgi:regulatory LuxR family protein
MTTDAIGGPATGTSRFLTGSGPWSRETSAIRAASASPPSAIACAKPVEMADVSGRLYVSPRTVQTHISHSLRKLGLRSRVELATTVATHR